MTVDLFVCGDVIAKTSAPLAIDKTLLNVIQAADISICNLEGPIVKNALPANKIGPCLSQPEETISLIKKFGFSHVNLANNHIYDYGEAGLAHTITLLKSFDIAYFGADTTPEEIYKVHKYHINGITLGVISAAEAQFGCSIDGTSPGFAWINNSRIDRMVLNEKCNVDFLIVIAHAGLEDCYIPLPEWRDRYKWLCDLGVDAVFGHHPHYPQGYEEHNGSLIFYSLGNFYFDPWNSQDSSGYSCRLTIGKSGIQDYEIHSHQTRNGTTSIAENPTTGHTMNELNKMLCDPLYLDKIDKLTLKLYQTIYDKYYSKAFASWPLYGLKNQLVFLVNCLLRRSPSKQQSQLMLLHNIQIESHRYVVQRALRLLTKQ